MLYSLSLGLNQPHSLAACALVRLLVTAQKPPQACVLRFGPRASCRISIERDILAVLYYRLRSSHCSSVVDGMLIPAKTLVTTVNPQILIAMCPHSDSQVNGVHFPTLMVKGP